MIKKAFFFFKRIENFIWSFGQQFSLKIVAFIVQIILARLLSPEDFGMIALILIFINIGQSLADGGMKSSLIRTIDADEDDYSTVFFINILMSFFVYILIYLLAPFVSDFYNIAELTSVIRILSLSFIFKSFNIVQSTIVVKELNFRKNFLIQLPSNIIASIFGIYLAYKGFGVWSLVFMSLIESFVNTLSYWFTSRWRPRLVFDKNKYLKHFSFGSKLTIAAVMNSIFQNIYTIVIGKYYNASIVGLYNRAESFNSFPVRMSITSVKSVSYPMLSKYSNDNIKLKSSYRKIMLHFVYWLTPILLLMFFNAETLFNILLTNKWNEAIPIFQILCIASIFYPLQEYNLQVLDIKGRSDIYLKIELVKKIITIIVLLIAINFTFYHLLYSQILLNIVFFIYSAIVCGKMIDYPLKEQLGDIIKIYILNLFALLTIILVSNYFTSINSLFSIPIFLIIYFTLSYLFKNECLNDLYIKIK